MEEKKREKAQPIRGISNAPEPLVPVSGRGSRIPAGSKPTQMPLDWPPSYPQHLIAQSTVIIGEALRKFPVQTHTLPLCKYVISELTPHFCDAVQSKTLRADLALSRMSDLLHSILVYNCDHSSERFLLEQETKKSDEWLKLARTLTKLAASSNGGSKTNRRELIDSFLVKLAESGRKIRRKDIWIVAGYKNPTEFERFQRGDARTTPTAIANFNRVLAMKPDDFSRSLDKHKTPR